MMHSWFIPLIILIPFISGHLCNFDGFVSDIVGSDVVHGEYIIVFCDDTDSNVVLTRIILITNQQAEAPSVLFHYSVVMNGVAMKGLSKDPIELLAEDKDIINIVEVCIVSCSGPAFSPQ